MLRKKIKLNESWTKTLSTTENLNGCITNLSESLNSVNSMLQVLDTINKESLRQSQVTTYKTPYELVTERDISIARLDVSHTLLLKCRKLLAKVNGLLHKLGQDELDVLSNLDRQTQLVHSLKQSTQTQPAPLDTRQRALKIEEMQHKIKQLEYQVHVENEKNQNVNLDIAKIKAKNAELSKDKVQSNRECEETPDELIQELSRLEAEADLKMKQCEIKRLPNVKKSESDLKVLCKTHLDKIQNVLNQLGRIGSGSTTQYESQCIEYLEALKNENITVDDSELKMAVEQVKGLCYLVFANHISGRTMGNVLGVMLLNDRVTVDELSKEFPWAEDERHNLTSILIILLHLHLIQQDGTQFIIETQG